LSLGNNFFPEGVDSVDDEAFSRCWRDVFVDAKVCGLRGIALAL
jgi:hypothetical protein